MEENKKYSDTYNERDVSEFRQWMVNKGKSKRELADVFINDNGEMKIEEKMVLVVETTPNDWKEFCEDTGREYEEVDLLAIY